MSMKTVPRDELNRCGFCGHLVPPGETMCPECGRSTEEMGGRDPLVNTIIRDYHVLEKLGEGGMGRTYRTRHTLLGSDRVIKIMHPWVSRHPDFSPRFHREAQLLASIHHPAIVTLHEFSYLDDGTPFMVMEYLRGETVADYLATKGALSIEKAISYIEQISQGLEFTHRIGIIHRDISPENILLVPDSSGELHAKLIDFGIAKLAVSGNTTEVEDYLPVKTGEGEERPGKTSTELYIGKPGYGSPEQFRQLKYQSDIDERTDIFSLGIVLYEMITNTPLFPKGSITGYLLSLIKYSEKGASSLDWAKIPPSVKDIILRCVAYHPRDRYGSVSELTKDIRHIQALQQVKNVGPDNPDPMSSNGETRPAERKPSATRKFSMLGMIPLAVMAIFLGQWLSSALQSPDNNTDTSISQPAPSPTLVLPLTPTIDDGTQALRLKKVLELLVAFNEALQQQRYTVPEEGNALSIGHAILEVDPENSTVLEQFYKIRTYYIELAQERLRAALFDQALDLLSKALLFFPNDPVLQTFIEQTIANKNQMSSVTVKGVTFVLVPGGTFSMGSPLNEADRFADEGPVHKVTLAPFYLMTTEMTNAHYRRFCQATGSEGPQDPSTFSDLLKNYFASHDNYPVLNVSWHDAHRAAKWFGGRLPTEAEWEYAVRASVKNTVYPWGNKTPKGKRVGNLADISFRNWKYFSPLYQIFSEYQDGYVLTSPAASFPANDFGLYDLEGNVREWCADWYDKDYYSSSPAINPRGPQSGAMKIVRGGCFSSIPRMTRCAFRKSVTPSDRHENYGFRLAMDFSPSVPLEQLPVIEPTIESTPTVATSTPTS